MDINDMIIYKKTIDAKQAEYAALPADLNPEIGEFLWRDGIREIYSHQAEMFRLAQEGKHVVITTATASGKTLSFLLPVLQEILKNPRTRAIFLYPTKALASDQYRALQPFLEYFGANRIVAGVYDGDTPPAKRREIRKSANIILTNPEMLNSAFLPNHSSYGMDFIFANLKYVVIDELHSYRGAFGSHLANVLRRLDRVCAYYQDSVQFLCSSATIANPVELAEKICGKPFVQVSRSGAPSPKKEYLLLQPPVIQGKNEVEYGRVSPATVAAGMIPELVEKKHSFLAFARTRRNVEVILKESRDRMEQAGFLGAVRPEQIAGYRGGYTPLERKEIERKMISGELSGLVSTNALELGIDIGKLDTTLLAGYPGTKASFWQQTGRAGRSGGPCRNFLVLANQPFDQYIAVNPDWLFESESEHAIVDPDNLLIQLSHIRAAAAELPLSLEDTKRFPDLGEVIPVLLSAKELENISGKFAWSGSAFPAGDYSLRNIDKVRYKLLNRETGREITEMDESQAYRELHPGAVYMHDGVLYEVLTLDLTSHTAQAAPFEGDYYTIPAGNGESRILRTFRTEPCLRTEAAFGDINVNEWVTMFKKLQFHNHQNLGYVQLEEPLQKDYDTESAWITIPANVTDAFRNLLQPNATGQWTLNNHFEGLAHALRNAAMMSTMASGEDVDTMVSNDALIPQGAVSGNVYLFFYDKYVGGLGYAEKICDVMETVIDNAIRLVAGCACKDGCPACVGDYTLDKQMVLWGLKNLREELPVPKTVKQYRGSTEPAAQKPDRTLPASWEEYFAETEKNREAGRDKAGKLRRRLDEMHPGE
ncbi:DEAD/DEAH box helicase [Hespellia stercorisuis]|uniref:DEAD/DEAH box helicase domain-containing protein n=1 Tax=Hespellia stercorisuis DSM 15480 TaxID=1121950 RepID=A0A1M6UCF7_9FIRM|nr:DEAD/DEAH box helicase [Hespellia stercorisuis]SHK66904.1 DEAD/DEAH box helicase domain-containing protein [Hespellia stercorisuis DSM 15480]